MKASPENPRFVCRVTRTALAVFGGEDAALRNGHVAGCEDCQAFFSGGEVLEQTLRRDAASQRAVAPAMLEQKFLHAVHRSVAPAPRSFGRPLFSVIAAAAALAVAFIALRPTTPMSPTGTAPVAKAPGSVDDATQALNDIIKLVPTNFFTEMRPQAEAILQQDPLQEELDSVSTSARSAVRFLAKNFLTSDAQESAARSRG
jgi:hypothetical protein